MILFVCLFTRVFDLFFFITKLIYIHGVYYFGTQKTSFAELPVPALQQLYSSSEYWIVPDFESSLNTKDHFFHDANRFKCKARNIKRYLHIFMHAVLVLRNTQTTKKKETKKEELKTQENELLFCLLSSNVYTQKLGSSYLSVKKVIQWISLNGFLLISKN